jgi:hypothetical protein
MFGVGDYWAFVIAVIVFLAIPGVGNLAIITSTSKGRVVGGLAATLGVIVGDQVLMWLAVAGVAALGAVALHLLTRQRPRATPLPTARFIPDRPARAPSRAIRPRRITSSTPSADSSAARATSPSRASTTSSRSA